MNRNYLVIKLLFLSNFNLLSAAISPGHQLVLAAAATGDIQTVRSFCLDPNETAGKQSALYAALKHNRRDIAYWLLHCGATVGADELTRAVQTANRPLTLEVFRHLPDSLRLRRLEKRVLKEAALKAGDPVIIGLLANRNLIHVDLLDKKPAQKKAVPLGKESTPKRNTEDLECVICLCPLKAPTQDKLFFNCNHGLEYFHRHCIKQAIKKTNKSCPLCRARFKI
ncbi:MAG: E3 ubiquitin-protein ligase [Proteobacteria bacterium]|nr:E3 ubiquitin-protein ligase [Pseudomonadota bacterium]NBP14072.1 E3 ubiquitin-protein ligase [bacterium]